MSVTAPRCGFKALKALAERSAREEEEKKKKKRIPYSLPHKTCAAVAHFNHVRPLMALSGRGCYVYLYKLF